MIGDLEDYPAWPPAQLLETRYGLRAFWSIPILRAGSSEWIGAVTFLCDSLIRPTEHDIKVGRLGARIVGIGAEKRKAQAQITHDALYDSLTDLPNRNLLLDRTAQAVQRARRNGTSIALLMVDLDRFKNINDSLGHSAGDQVLMEVGRRFLGVVRPADTVARLGGDEFLVLYEGARNEADLVQCAQRILASLRPPIHVGSHEVHIGASIGIAVAAHEVNPEVLVRDADAAMYRAKDNGRGRFEIFDTEMRQLTLTRIDVEDRLHHAVETDLVQIHYQPIVDLRSLETVGTEALARWTDWEIGEVPPADFIPIAEDNGLIVSLGMKIMRSACIAASRWPSGITVSVNVSGRQMQEPDLADNIESAMSAAGLDPMRLMIELTESVLMKDVTASTGTLNRLNDLGVRLAIDDFGTGYSSLARLKRFPVAQLKIDRSFVVGLPDDENNVALVKAVITMGHSLGLEVLAEGIETQEQLSALQSLGCDLGQGYFFSKALPESEFTAWLGERDFQPIPRELVAPT